MTTFGFFYWRIGSTYNFFWSAKRLDYLGDEKIPKYSDIFAGELFCWKILHSVIILYKWIRNILLSSEKLNKSTDAAAKVLAKICTAMNWDVSDIVEIQKIGSVVQATESKDVK